MIKIVVFDADKTLWDHYNISIFKKPYKLINENSIEDSEGNKLTLFPEVRETLKNIKDMGLLLGLATWNLPEKTDEILSLLGLKEYFDIIVSKDFPFKFIFLIEIINKIREKGISIKPDEIMFIDDRRVHFGNTWLYLGNVKCVEIWSDIFHHKQILEKIKSF
ncbi:magnesium-dependent phosphatase-1 [Sulfurisphaera javensis]|uniref:Magnesium-dependent phosphatase-1 n=1 Tax=Sulfurisphaera javensis TaxID=2049879 RepID=A0AAT9GUH2_9CREN